MKKAFFAADPDRNTLKLANSQLATMQNYSLYVKLLSLDRISVNPVFAIELKNISTFIYPVELDDKFLPKNLKLECENKLITKQNIPDTLIKIPNNDWSSCLFRYHAITALHCLGIIPSLSKSTYTSPELYDRYCSKFFETYKLQNQPIDIALSQLFCKLFFFLSIFNFTNTSVPEEILSFELCQNMCSEFNEKRPESHENRYFAFSELKYAIENFHNSCFPDRSLPPHILDYDSYHSLMSTVVALRCHLVRLDFLSNASLTPYDVVEAIQSYQSFHKLPVGNCDFYTLRHIWNQSMAQECSIYGACNLCGVYTTIPDEINFHETLGKMKRDQKKPELTGVTNLVNEIFRNVYTHREVPNLMVKRLEEAVDKQVRFISELDSSQREVVEAIKKIEGGIVVNKIKNENTKREMAEANSIMESVMLKWRRMKKEAEKVKNIVEIQRKGNTILAIIILSLIAYVVYKYIQK